MTTFKITSTVNINDSCNAYYDGNVNFFQKGGGCNNTGRIADVNYHEWGHGVHYSAAGSYYLTVLSVREPEIPSPCSTRVTR